MQRITMVEMIYYGCLSCETSQELLNFVKKHLYFFRKMKPSAQEQIRKEYKRMREQEEFDFK